MTELEAIALVYGINIEEAKNIDVDDIPDDLYAEILELMKRDSENITDEWNPQPHKKDISANRR